MPRNIYPSSRGRDVPPVPVGRAWAVRVARRGRGLHHRREASGGAHGVPKGCVEGWADPLAWGQVARGADARPVGHAGGVSGAAEEVGGVWVCGLGETGYGITQKNRPLARWWALKPVM